MICQATYDSYDAIPEAFREEFELRDGVYVIKESAIPGAASALNPGLAGNRDRALGQLRSARARVTELETQVSTLQSEVETLRTASSVPEGSVVLGEKDAKSWKKYTAMGTPQELEVKVNEHKDLSAKVARMNAQQEAAKLSTELGLNADVLSDWRNHPEEGSGIAGITTKTEKDSEGNDVKVAYVTLEKEVDGKIRTEEVKLLDHAKSVLPDWKFKALTASSEDGDSGNEGGGENEPSDSGIRLPKMESGKKDPGKGSDKDSIFSRFQDERDSAPSPFDLD